MPLVAMPAAFFLKIRDAGTVANELLTEKTLCKMD